MFKSGNLRQKGNISSDFHILSIYTHTHTHTHTCLDSLIQIYWLSILPDLILYCNRENITASKDHV